MRVDDIKWTFGQLEARLADIHDIADDKRTAFQARLKNFHRLRYPLGFETKKGKTAIYNAGDIVAMALAIELTQLGLPPERTANVLGFNWYPTIMAVRLASRSLSEKLDGFSSEMVHSEHDPLSMFIFFDPSALANLRDSSPQKFGPDFDDAVQSFFYGGAGIVQENLVKWTSGYVDRISLLNVTSLIDRLAGLPFGDDVERNLLWRKRFFQQLVEWSENTENERNPEAAGDYLFNFIAANPIERDADGSFESGADWLVSATGIAREKGLQLLIEFENAYNRRDDV